MKMVQVFEKALTENLLHELRRAVSEASKKEKFLLYLQKIFEKDRSARALAGEMAHGAERTVANIPRGLGRKTGRADTQTETLIIEWERDLTKTGSHAVEQLKEYLAGNWNSGREYRYVLITTDGLRWRVYAPEWAELKKNFKLGAPIELRQIRSFELNEKTLEEFPFFLDEVLFGASERIATLESIQNDFGNSSSAFINSLIALEKCLSSIKKKSELQVAFDQWKRFLSIAYGSFDDSPEMYLIHTYLSVFSKLIAYAVLTGKVAREERTLKEVLRGNEFHKLNVDRFVEDDFFHWVAADEHFNSLRPMFRELNRKIGEYDFSQVQEDILKGVYQELIDLETRHALGEYYTPDWLCERVMHEFNLRPSAKVLDPACGSGSFLRAAISSLQSSHKSLTADKLAAQVCGIDIHPLSVQIAKTTILLTLGDSVAKAPKPVSLRVYLANSLLVPKETADLFKSSFRVNVDNRDYTLDLSALKSADDFDDLVTFCDDVVHQDPEPLNLLEFKRLARSLSGGDTLITDLHKVYLGMKEAFDNGRDSIWKFVLQNTYKPVFMRSSFDVVVGNPPWLTYSGITNAEYQTALRKMADDYALTPNMKNMPHLEIAAIFFAHSVNYFLKPEGRLGFVLPRSFMTADQHGATRAGTVKGVKITGIWDLDRVAPLFRVPCCVLFATHGHIKAAENALPSGGVAGITFEGKLPRAHLHLGAASRYVKEESTQWFYSQLKKSRGLPRSAFTRTKLDAVVGANYYASGFKQGATIVPRSFYFIDFDQELASDDYSEKIIPSETSQSILRDAKHPWRDITIQGRVEGNHIFRTAISKNVLPFGLVNPPWVVLPAVVEGEGKAAKFVLLDERELLARGARNTSNWMSKVKKHWLDNRTESNGKNNTSYIDYLNWQNKLSEQRPGAKHFVLYTGSATDASAVVVEATDLDAPLAIDHKTYWIAPATSSEAHYLSAYLNSGYANEQIKEFQSRGLFGARDIHKLIVSLPFPKYDSGNGDHKRLSELGELCAQKVKKLLRPMASADLDKRSLGAARNRIRDTLAEQYEEIDRLVEQISTGRHVAQLKSAGKGTRRRGAGQASLFDL